MRKVLKRFRKKENELIPLQQSRRVIYLDKRGYEKKHMPSAILFWGLGAICLLYCLGIAVFTEPGTFFYGIWGILGVLFLLWGWVMTNPDWIDDWLPNWIKMSVKIVIIIGIVLFFIVEGMIVGGFWKQPPDGADYCIILGAQVKDSGPSDVLQRRLNAAIDYLKKNLDTKVIVSGGKGSNEPMSEAEGMYQYLIDAGIESQRITMEAQSKNTYTNLRYSSEFLEKEKDSVVIVTNNFHIFRATNIAKKQGYEKVYGLAASSYPGMLPNNLFREFFGVIKDFLVGNI